MLGAKNPFVTYQIMFGIKMNKLPSLIENQSIILSGQGMSPFGIFESLGHNCGFTVISGSELGRKVELFNGFVNIVFGSSNNDSWGGGFRGYGAGTRLGIREDCVSIDLAMISGGGVALPHGFVGTVVVEHWLIGF